MVYAPVILAVLMMISAFVSPYRILPKLDQVELKTGYGFAQNDENQPTGFQMTPVLPSVNVPLTETFGPDWLRVRIEWNPELSFGLFSYPYVKPWIGFNPLHFRYKFMPKSRCNPYLLAGAGIFYADIDREETGSDFNFSGSVGIGLQHKITDNASLLLEWRFTHISNAGMDERNSGIDSYNFLAGFSLKR